MRRSSYGYRWTNYKGRTSYVSEDEIRTPVLRRQVPVTATLWPSIKPDFMQGGDAVQHIHVDGTRGEVLTIESNDPFKAAMLMCEHPGREFRYEHLAEVEAEPETEPEGNAATIETDVELQEEPEEESDDENSIPDEADTAVTPQGAPQGTSQATTSETARRRQRRTANTPQRARRGTSRQTTSETVPRRQKRAASTATHVKKKIAKLLDFGEGTVFPEEVATSELAPLDEATVLAAVSDLNRQVAALEKEPTFELPQHMTNGVLLQQNTALVERNQELMLQNQTLSDSNKDLRNRMDMLESRVRAVESKFEQVINSNNSTPSNSPPDPTQGTPVSTEPVSSTRRSPLLYLQGNNIPRVAVELSRELFTTEERLHCCVNGKGANRLDPEKVATIRDRLFELCPMPRSQQPAAWKDAVKAIDSHTRYLRHRQRQQDQNLE